MITSRGQRSRSFRSTRRPHIASRYAACAGPVIGGQGAGLARFGQDLVRGPPTPRGGSAIPDHQPPGSPDFPFAAGRRESFRDPLGSGVPREYCDADETSVMTTAVIGTGVLGSAVARRLASGGERLRLGSADAEAARKLAAQIGPTATVAADNHDALLGSDDVVLALRFTALKSVIDEIADALADKLVVVPSNPLSTDGQGHVVRLLAEGQSSGEVVAGWLPAHARLAMSFGTMSADLFESSSNRSPERAVLFYVSDDDRAGEQVERLIRTAGFEPMRVGGVGQSGRLEVGGDLHDLVVDPTEARALLGKS